MSLFNGALDFLSIYSTEVSMCCTGLSTVKAVIFLEILEKNMTASFQTQ